jgi:DNA-binding CsgD family transcriptional regulator
MLLDRVAEREVLGQLLDSARDGRSGALVVWGEPGAGKSALLDYAVESSSGLRLARAVGVESEMELAFAALHQLCGPMLDRLDRLPPAQRDALSVALGLSAGDAPDRFLVGLAVLGLLARAAERQPLLCVIDDAQWLDRASAQMLGFVARRLLGEAVALVFATREPIEEFSGLPKLLVGGLADRDADALLDSVLRVAIDQRVRERIVAETRGNPLALLELPRGMTPAELAGGFGVLGAPRLSGRIEESFQRREAALPAATRRLLLVAAAEPVGDPVLLWRAAGRLAIGPEAAVAAQVDGLLTIGARVTFRHPLARSAVYGAASLGERRAVHQALAEATDPEADPDRRAWHRAQAAAGPDENVAGELERSAGRARARGGLAAAAAFLDRAAALTPDPAHRAERALAAAQANQQAGAFDAALGLLAAAEVGPLTEVQRARADLLRGQIAFASSRGSDAPPLLLKAAKRFELLDVELARETYLEALSAAVYAGRFAAAGGLREVAEAARTAPAASQPPSAPDLLLDGLALLITQGDTAAAPTLKRALSAFSSEGFCGDEALRWLWLAHPAAQVLWDDQSWDLLSTRDVQVARDAGALGVLPMALSQHAVLHLYEGDFAATASMIEEADAITAATRTQLPPYAPLGLAAFRGRELQAAELIEPSTRDLVRRGEGVALTFVQWATSLLCNGLGRYQDALAAAQQAAEDPHELVFSMWASVELIEAATRSGQPEHAAAAFKRLSDSTRASGSDWALGTVACSGALLSDNDTADDLYREAIDRFGRTRLRVPLARAHLLYGEWLRRERRSRDARVQLHRALELFTDLGMEGFADRARVELRAAGGHARKRAAGAREDLTAQEAQISGLAASGATNAEIALQLFISPATVAYHLRKVFAKLGIDSRSQLAQSLSAAPNETPVRRRDSARPGPS